MNTTSISVMCFKPPKNFVNRNYFWRKSSQTNTYGSCTCISNIYTRYILKLLLHKFWNKQHTLNRHKTNDNFYFWSFLFYFKIIIIDFRVKRHNTISASSAFRFTCFEMCDTYYITFRFVSCHWYIFFIEH